MINIKEVEGGIVIPVKVQPGSSRNGVIGEHDSRIKIAVALPPEKGKANKAVMKVLAEWLDIKVSDFKIITGERSRDKEVFVRNVTIKDISGYEL